MFIFPAACFLWCHRCQQVRKHIQLTCVTCHNHKNPTEVVVTYGESDGEIYLPLNLLPIGEIAFRMRKLWLQN